MMRYYPGWGGYGMMDWGFFGFLSGMLHFLFWLVVIILVVRLIRRKGLLGDRRHIWMHQGALDILKERYAKGEINKTEYEEKKKDLEA